MWYEMEYYSAIKKEWKLVTYDDMNGIGNISEISQGKTNTVWFHLYV